MRGRVGWGYRRQITGVGDKRLAVALQGLLDHRMPAGLDRETERGIYFGPHIIVVDRELGERGRDVKKRKRMRRVAQLVARSQRLAAQPFEDFQLEIERAFAGIGDLSLGLAQLGAGAA